MRRDLVFEYALTMRRLTSVYQFAWKPIITFGARRLRLLEWIDAEVSPIAFTDSEDHVGFATDEQSIRITALRDGVILEDRGLYGHGVQSLQPALEGVMRILAPESVVLKSAALAWTEPTPMGSYDDTRASFAAGLADISIANSALLPVDASVLMDLEGPEYSAQVEWGIVSASELVKRLREPGLSRVSAHRAQSVNDSEFAGELPEASLFVDTSIFKPVSEVIVDQAGMEETIDFVTAISENIAQNLYSSVVGKMGREK
ncbi:MAG: hypothetical protein ABWX92_16285 [Mycetocola sp.]